MFAEGLSKLKAGNKIQCPFGRVNLEHCRQSREEQSQYFGRTMLCWWVGWMLR